MGLYVELMCDVRKEGQKPDNILVALCWSNRNDNEQGFSVMEAQAEGRRQKWKVGPGRKAVCPGCLAALEKEPRA